MSEKNQELKRAWTRIYGEPDSYAWSQVVHWIERHGRGAICEAQTEQRGQHAVGTWPRQGPDQYIAVQVVPEGSEPLRCLSAVAARRRNIQIIQCGEGYQGSDGPRSRLGAALEVADQIEWAINWREARRAYRQERRAERRRGPERREIAFRVLRSLSAVVPYAPKPTAENVARVAGFVGTEGQA